MKRKNVDILMTLILVMVGLVFIFEFKNKIVGWISILVGLAASHKEIIQLGSVLNDAGKEFWGGEKGQKNNTSKQAIQAKRGRVEHSGNVLQAKGDIHYTVSSHVPRKKSKK